MGCLVAVFGFILPRFLLLVGWSNDPTFWNSVFGSQLWLGVGFLALPWTTFIYGLTERNGLTPLNILFILLAVVLDIGTWGGGILGTRRQTSNFRDA